MSEPDRRYATVHGSSAFTGTPLPGQPLADQPTEVVPRVPRAADGPPTAAGFWHRDDDRDDDRPDPWEAGSPGGARPADVPDDPGATRPDYRDTPVVVRRSDTLAGLLLVLAGIAAGVSLLVVWLHGGATGLDLVRTGVDELGEPQRLADGTTWAAPAVVGGGAVLFVLGLLMYVPGRTHRFLGALALLVTLVVAAGVLVPLADLHWQVAAWAVGAWFAVAVAGLGFLGALKALSTGPRRG